MEKNIKDYLHLYLGCECEIDKRVASTKKTGTLTNIDQTGVRLKGAFNDGHIAHALVKPILRPLSDLTKEEVKILDEMARTQKNGEQFIKRETKFFSGIRTRSAEALHYLLSKHFDLFGLIDAGLAIDKTKQPLPSGHRGNKKII